MNHPQKPTSQIFRILVALGVFVTVLCAVLYLGFGVKFQPINIKGLSGTSSSKSGPPTKPLFYHSIGKAGSQNPNNSAANATIGKRFTLEIQMTNDRQQAEQTVDRLAEKGIQAYYTPLQNNGRIVYRVRRGIYPSETVALRAADELRQQKKINVKVVQLN